MELLVSKTTIWQLSISRDGMLKKSSEEFDEFDLSDQCDANTAISMTVDKQCRNKVRTGVGWGVGVQGCLEDFPKIIHFGT